MHIAFLSREYITEESFAGGMANYLYRTAKLLKERGHYIEIFTLSDKNGELEQEGIMVHRIKGYSFMLKVIWTLTFLRFSETIRILFNAYVMHQRLMARHKKNKFDIVQATGTEAVGLFTACAQRIPLVTRISSYRPLWRAYEDLPATWDRQLIEFLEVKQRKLSQAVYAPSELIADIIQEKENISVDVIRPAFVLGTTATDNSLYNRELKAKKYFLFFGTLCKKKGIDILAQALRKLFNEGKEINFVFAGKQLKVEGLPATDYIYKVTGLDKYSHRLRYLGVLRHNYLYPIIRGAHAVVLPSKIDNFPNTCLEAMALGKVVIGTRGASYEEMIDDGISGFLVEKEDPVGLADMLDKAWNMDDDVLLKIGQNAQKKIASLNSQEQIAILEQYYTKYKNA